MKRRVLCIFILVFWMLAACTFLSIRIEQLMIPTISTVSTDDKDPEPNIPADALFYDETGMHLYRSWMGSGWESGLRVHEVAVTDYYIQDDKLMLTNSGDYIWYATRTLRNGEEVKKAEAFQYEEDTWVAVYPDGVPEYRLSLDTLHVEAENDTALLISAEEANRPFMEGRARSYVETEKDAAYYYEAPNNTFYSLADLKQFMDSMLLLGLLVGLLLFTVVLWGFCCVLSRKYTENGKLLAINGGIGAVLLACVPLLLHFIDLPSSMLPQYHITDFAHYAAEFSELFGVLRSFAESGNAIAENAIRYAENRILWAFLIAAAGIVVGAAVIVAESLLRRRPADKPKHAAW